MIGDAPRTLIADDDEDIRSLIEIAAKRAGLDTRWSVADGRSALEAIETGDVEVAILDVAMPELTGLEVLTRTRQGSITPDVKVVIISASVDVASLAAGMEAGADEYIAKPFSPRQLGERLTELVAEWKAAS